MKQIFYAWKMLMHNKAMTLTKIISLGLGLTMCILLFARIDFENSYDTSFKDHDRIYQLWMQWNFNGEICPPNAVCVGALAGGVMEGLPEYVESATTAAHFFQGPLRRGDIFFHEPKITADSLFFRTLGIEVLRGDHVRDLAQPDNIYLSQDLARKMFADEDPVGQTITYNGTLSLTVRGIYRDIPENTSFRPSAVISLPTLLSRSDINHSWYGGDSWWEFIKLRDKGIDNGELDRRINMIVQQNAPDTDEVGMYAFARPLTETHRSIDENANRIYIIMWVLAVALLFIASLNYALISISSLSHRAKAIGVHKCSGAGAGSVFLMFILETLFILIGAMAVMAILLLNFSEFIEDTLSTPISELFALHRLWIPIAVMAGVLVLGGILPGRIFATVPVSQVFRRFTERKKSWKRVLLFVEFTGVAFIGSLLCIMFVQYHYVVNKDKGYDLTRLAIGDVPNVSDNDEAILAVFKGIPYIEDVSSSWSDPISGYSGEFMKEEGNPKIFSSRIDFTADGYIDLMGMTVLQGRPPEADDEVMINQTFINWMGWDEKDVLTKHPEVISNDRRYKITGVLKDFVIIGFLYDRQAYLMHHNDNRKLYDRIVVKLAEPFEENLQRLNKDIAEAFPTVYVHFESMEKQSIDRYDDIRVFRNITLLASIAIIIITAMGLIGFVNDEINRRAKEIAIRKVNGAETDDILTLMLRDIMIVAIPAVTIGTLAAAYIGSIWLEVFTVKADNIWIYYIISALIILAAIATCVVAMSWSTAIENPSKSLKTE